MGVRNYLVEGASLTGKTAVCDELRRRGYRAIHGDRELAYQGDPASGEPLEAPVATDDDDDRAEVAHEHHVWDVAKVEALVADRRDAVTFFCGGSRNLSTFISLFDSVFVLEIDAETLNRRLAARPDDDWGGRPAERDLIRRLHQNQDDVPRNATRVDGTAPLTDVVDEILRHCGLERVRLRH